MNTDETIELVSAEEPGEPEQITGASSSMPQHRFLRKLHAHSTPCPSSIPARAGTGPVARGAAAGPAFEWNVQNFSRLQAPHNYKDQKMYSEPFEAGGVNWRILMFPRGNGKPSEQASLSMYLDVHNAESLPVLNDTRSTVRRRWSERACVGCAGGMAILRNVRPCDLEPQDKHSVEEECVAHVLCGRVRRPPLPHTRWAWAWACWHARVWAIAPRPPWE